MKDFNIVLGAVLGHAVGDALGVPVEFVPREKLQNHPVVDMMGYGTHDVPKGSWSDDTSMELCTLHSIAVKGKIDLDDIMTEFSKWVEDGYMTPQGKVFDIGRTCLRAICNYNRGSDVSECGLARGLDNGNGSLMRIIPVSLYNYFEDLDDNASIMNIHAVSALTHANKRSCIACGIYDFVLRELLEKPEVSSIKIALKKAEQYYNDFDEIKHYSRLFSESFALTDISEIKSSGYVVDTLEAALWCIFNTASYEDCVLKAVNLGGDTDTVAAVAGGIAGVIYGYEQIPGDCLNSLVMKDEIISMCADFYRVFDSKEALL